MDIFGLGLIHINNWLLLFIGFLTAIYFYYTWNFGYFKAQGINGPRPLPIFGNFLSVMKKGIHSYFIEGHVEYGDIYGTFQGRKPTYVVKDPDFLRHVFVKDQANFVNRSSGKRGSKILDSMLTAAQGDHWKDLRSIMSPTFSTGKIRQMTLQINECAQELVDNLAEKATTKEAFEIKEYAGAFSMDVIASTAFGLKINSQQDKNNKFVEMAKKSFKPSPIGFLIFFFPFLTPILKRFGVSVLPAEIERFFTGVTKKTLEARQESGQTRKDFMQLLINAHEDNAEEKREDKEHDKDFKELYGNVKKRSLTHDEVIAQSLLFFLAGYETTANAISFLVYNLTIHPDMQEKLYEEIMEAAGDKDIDYSMLGGLSLLDMCVHESLRMYAPAVLTQRECNRDTTIKGITVHKGTVVSIPIHAIHYDPKTWPEPEKFDPYRFTKEEKAKHGPYDWIPFGAGPRNCIAMRLALIEVQIAVASLVRKYKLIKCEKTEVPLKLNKLRTSADNGIWIQLEKR